MVKNEYQMISPQPYISCRLFVHIPYPLAPECNHPELVSLSRPHSSLCHLDCTGLFPIYSSSRVTSLWIHLCISVPDYHLTLNVSSTVLPSFYGFSSLRLWAGKQVQDTWSFRWIFRGRRKRRSAFGVNKIGNYISLTCMVQFYNH